MSILAASCSAPPIDPRQDLDGLREALTFHASFDQGSQADFALGDRTLYSTSSRKLEDGVPGIQVEHVRLAGGEGRFGGALHFEAKQPGVVFFRAEGNVAYEPRNWEGTVSFWLSLDPDRDLEPGYSDPLMITERGWDDGALFVDFTRDDSPRHFRLGVFSDRSVWNPEGRKWEEIGIEERPMVDVSNPPFGRDYWTHVVFTFKSFNTGQADAVSTLYLDGQRQGSIEGRRQWITLDISRTGIVLGMDYIGKIDDLSIFNRALTDEEVRQLHDLDYGAGALHGSN